MGEQLGISTRGDKVIYDTGKLVSNFGRKLDNYSASLRIFVVVLLCWTHNFPSLYWDCKELRVCVSTVLALMLVVFSNNELIRLAVGSAADGSEAGEPSGW